MTRDIIIFVVGCLAGLLVGVLAAAVYPKRKDTLFREYLMREYGEKK